MKYICLLVACAVFAILTSVCQADVLGPASFKFTGTYQVVPAQIMGSTNKNSTITNIVVTTKSTTSNAPINNSRLLQMLENSFNTNFPTGAALKLNDAAIFVVAVGTNVVLNVSGVLTLSITNDSISAGSFVTKDMFSKNGVSQQINQGVTITSAAIIDYNDSLLSTKDGTTTRFSAKGVAAIRVNISGLNETLKTSNFYTFSGSGSGSVSNSVVYEPFILKGSFIGSTSSTFTP